MMLFITMIYAESIEIPDAPTQLERIINNDPTLKSVTLSCAFHEEINALERNTTVQSIIAMCWWPHDMCNVLKFLFFSTAILCFIVVPDDYKPWVAMVYLFPFMLQKIFDMRTAYSLSHNLEIIDALGFGSSVNQILKRNRLYAAVKANAPALTSVDLTGVDISYQKVASAFTEVLKHNFTVRKLKRNCKYFSCGSHIGFDIAEILRANKRLRLLEVKGWSMQASEIKNIAEALNNNFVITELEGISDRTVQQLVKRNAEFRSHLRRCIFYVHEKFYDLRDRITSLLPMPEKYKEEMSDIVDEVRQLRLLVSVRALPRSALPRSALPRSALLQSEKSELMQDTELTDYRLMTSDI